MKRILLVCCLFALTCTAPFIKQAAAQMPAVTLASFTVKVNQLDSFIGIGNMPLANRMADELNQTMMIVAQKSKNDMYAATTPADKAKFTGINTKQMSLYDDFWKLRPSLAANRAAMHTKLGQFAATIY